MSRNNWWKAGMACLLSLAVAGLFTPAALGRGGGGGGGGGHGGGGHGGGGGFSGGHAGGFSGGHGGGFSGGHAGGYSGGHVGGFSGSRAGSLSSGHMGSYGAPRAYTASRANSFGAAHVGTWNSGHVNNWSGRTNTWNGQMSNWNHAGNWNGHTNSWNHPWDHQFWNGHFDHGHHDHFVFVPGVGFGWWPWFNFGWWPGYYGYGYRYPYVGGYYGNYGDYGYDQPYVADYSAPDTSGGMPDMTMHPQPAVAAETSDYYTEAVASFQQGDYANAARLTGHASIDQPRDANVHLLLTLGLFALGDYRAAAMEAHAVVALGQVPTWETVYGFYDNVEPYTTQLRALEKFVRENPKSPEGRFLLGFQYAITNYKDAARDQLLRAVELGPQDRLAGQLLKSVGGTVPAHVARPPVPAPVQAVPVK
jgi:hypothetical protein